MLLFLLGTAVVLAFTLAPAQRRLRALWRLLRGLAPRAAALLGVALLVLFVQIGGSLNKNPPDGLCPNSTNHYALQEFNLSAFSPIIEEEPL